MSDRPEIKLHEWIDVEGASCVVANIREDGSQFGDCEVVLNPKKPANRDVRWNGEDWEFLPSGDYGGYADSYPRLAGAVAVLKRGRWKSGKSLY